MLDLIIQNIVDTGNNLLFFNILFWQNDFKLPFLIAWLVFSSLFFSIIFLGKNFRLIPISIKLLLSQKFTDKQDKDIKETKIQQEKSKDIIMFTIGSCVDIGSMFGVALMVKQCGVGSIFWVLISGILATSIRFAEVFMGHHYRVLSPNKISYIGGPQIYIKKYFSEKGFLKIGIILSTCFTVMLFCSTFFSPQLNQTASTLRHFVPVLKDYDLLFCFTLSIIVVFIVSGGFHRIISVASKIVSIMSKVYILIAFIVIFFNYNNIVPLLQNIFIEAFTIKAGFGGFLTMIVFAIQRGFFCNESGMGSGAMSHANSVNKDSVQEAVISMITPILTTSVLCVTSGLIVAITDAHLHGDTGLEIMMHALGTVHSSFHYVLFLLVPLFGISTAIAWAYYGQRAFGSLFGEKNIFIYNVILFISYIICSKANNFQAVLNLADIANLGITIPNIIVLLFASKFIANKIKTNII